MVPHSYCKLCHNSRCLELKAKKREAAAVAVPARAPTFVALEWHWPIRWRAKSNYDPGFARETP